jgi:hypothetical protein
MRTCYERPFIWSWMVCLAIRTVDWYLKPTIEEHSGIMFFMLCICWYNYHSCCTYLVCQHRGRQICVPFVRGFFVIALGRGTTQVWSWTPPGSVQGCLQDSSCSSGQRRASGYPIATETSNSSAANPDAM